MKRFNILIELSNQEIKLLKSIDWEMDEPKAPDDKASEMNDLANKGIIMEIVDYQDGSSCVYLTDIGKQIIKL